ncbi:MAG: hypothetical protein WCI73_11495 [Phycisphaerae bacterium]
MIHKLSILLAFVALCTFAGLVRAEDKTDAVTLKGMLACAKCSLHEKDATGCQNVLVVKDGDKTTNYYVVDNDVSKAAHGKVCHHSSADVTITGTIAEKDSKQWITPTKIEFAEKPAH